VPRILHLVPSYYPATYWGGPIYSTKAICDGVSALKDFQLRVLTTDASGPSVSDRVSVERNPLGFEEGYGVYYAKRIAGSSISIEFINKLASEIRWADLVHLTGTYSFPTLPAFVIARLAGKPLVWSPRGALQASAEWPKGGRMYSKLAFEKVARWLVPPGTRMHVTSKEEAKLSMQRMPRLDASIIPNSVNLPENIPKRNWRPQSKVRLLFISRLHKKKGLEMLLEVMLRLPENFELYIYGTGEEEYVSSLEHYVMSNGLSKRVKFGGQVEGESKEQAFYEADIFLLPSYSENFGIVVAEALGRGLPVIVSKSTPWSEVEKRGCGYWVKLGRSEFASAIVCMAGEDLEEMGTRGRQWMEREYSPVPIADRMVSLYHEVLTNQKTLKGEGQL